MTFPEMSMPLPAALRRLPPLPQAAIAALQVIRDQRSQRSDLVRVLSLDQALTGLFLRMVNSAYYSLPRRIASLDEAIGFLGYETVQGVIFAVSASKMLSAPVPAYMLEQGMLWQHAVATASGSQWIARKKRIAQEAEAYVAGLLHDVGKLAMDALVEHQTVWYSAAQEETGVQRLAVDLERSFTGYDHAEAGAVLVQSWNLPDTVVESIAWHHCPQRAELAPPLAAAVHIANAAALMAGIGLGVDGLQAFLDPAAIDQLNWTQLDMENLISSMQPTIAEAKAILGRRS